MMRIHDQTIQTGVKSLSGLKGEQLEKLTHFGKVMDAKLPDRTLRIILGLRESPSLKDILDSITRKSGYSINKSGLVAKVDPFDAQRILDVINGRTGLKLSFPDRLNSYPIAFLTAKTGLQNQGISGFFTFDASEGFGVRPISENPGIGAWFKAQDAKRNGIKSAKTGILLTTPVD